MARYDWLDIIGMVTLAASVGLLIIIFAM